LQQVLKDLIELQKLDIKMMELERLRGDLPRQVKELENKLNLAEKSVSEKEANLQSLRMERDKQEGEIAELENKREKYKQQLFDVKSNREYDAVTMEIEQVNVLVSDKESRVLEIIDIVDDLKSTLEQDKKNFEELKREHAIKKEELNKKIKETEKDEAFLIDHIDKLRRKLSPRYLAVYDRIRKAKGGVAVVPVIRRSCGGCYKNLPPQKVLEIRKMDRIHLCEVCGRILIWDDNLNEENK